MSIKSNKIFRRAVEHIRNDKYSEANLILKSILEKSLSDEDKIDVLIQYAGSLYFSKEYVAAYQLYKDALKMKDDEEILSLGFYLTCVELDKIDEGLNEMERYLTKHPPILFKDSIIELVQSLKNGYSTDFATVIHRLKLKL